MKMSIKSLLAMCAMYLLTSGLVLAQTEPADFFIFTDGSCGMLDENGDGVIFADGVQISANSANGNVTLICSVKLDREVNIKRSKIWNYDNTFDNELNGGKCLTLDGPTDDWHQIITPNGNAKLVCHLKQ